MGVDLGGQGACPSKNEVEGTVTLMFPAGYVHNCLFTQVWGVHYPTRTESGPGYSSVPLGLGFPNCASDERYWQLHTHARTKANTTFAAEAKCRNCFVRKTHLSVLSLAPLLPRRPTVGVVKLRAVHKLAMHLRSARVNWSDALLTVQCVQQLWCWLLVAGGGGGGGVVVVLQRIAKIKGERVDTHSAGRLYRCHTATRAHSTHLVRSTVHFRRRLQLRFDCGSTAIRPR